jgi:N-acetylneuraminic acid mutarotase
MSEGDVEGSIAFYRYDPATNSWTARANLPVPLRGAVGASDGTYGYVACGVTPGWNYTNTLYRYDPSTNSWTNLSTVPGGVGRWYLLWLTTKVSST